MSCNLQNRPMRQILALMVYTETETWSVQVGGPRALSTIVRPYHMDGGVSWKPALSDSSTCISIQLYSWVVPEGLTVQLELSARHILGHLRAITVE